MAMEDALLFMTLWLPGVVVESIGTLLVQLVWRRCCCIRVVCKESAPGFDGVPASATSFVKMGAKQKRLIRDEQSDCGDRDRDMVIYVPLTGNCIHLIPQCGSMKNAKKFFLCSKCFGR